MFFSVSNVPTVQYAIYLSFFVFLFFPSLLFENLVFWEVEEEEKGARKQGKEESQFDVLYLPASAVEIGCEIG